MFISAYIQIFIGLLKSSAHIAGQPLLERGRERVSKGAKERGKEGEARARAQCLGLISYCSVSPFK